jgi:hypothetical protein
MNPAMPDPATILVTHARLSPRLKGAPVRINLIDFDPALHTRVDDQINDPTQAEAAAFARDVGVHAHQPPKPSSGSDFGG